MLPIPKTHPTMPHHPTLDQLEKLRFHGMTRALRDQSTQPDINRLSDATRTQSATNVTTSQL